MPSFVGALPKKLAPLGIGRERQAEVVIVLASQWAVKITHSLAGLDRWPPAPTVVR